MIYVLYKGGVHYILYSVMFSEGYFAFFYIFEIHIHHHRNSTIVLQFYDV